MFNFAKTFRTDVTLVFAAATFAGCTQNSGPTVFTNLQPFNNLDQIKFNVGDKFKVDGRLAYVSHTKVGDRRSHCSTTTAS